VPTIQVKLREKQAQKLSPYRARLAELLDLGLQVWLEREDQQDRSSQEQLLQALAASSAVAVPQPYTGEEPYHRRTPVPINGKPVSELVVEGRGVL